MNIGFENTPFGEFIGTLSVVDKVEGPDSEKKELNPEQKFLLYLRDYMARWIDKNYPNGIPFESVSEWMKCQKAFEEMYPQLKEFEMSSPIDCFLCPMIEVASNFTEDPAELARKSCLIGFLFATKLAELRFDEERKNEQDKK